tara:strand:+ start:1178 stop:1381 length:204 start_codon:yes stop_codon:yes gene_type:complete
MTLKCGRQLPDGEPEKSFPARVQAKESRFQHRIAYTKKTTSKKNNTPPSSKLHQSVGDELSDGSYKV